MWVSKMGFEASELPKEVKSPKYMAKQDRVDFPNKTPLPNLKLVGIGLQ